MGKIKDALKGLTPTQAAIVGLLFIGSAILAGIALYLFTLWNKRQTVG